jgi:hypothetical protein
MWPSPPYFAIDDDNSPPSQPRFVLEQIDDNKFSVSVPFVYRPSPPREQVEVSISTLPTTDLASIPWFVSWFVSRHGRHTPAALVHDCLVHQAREKGDPVARAQADQEFLNALDELNVPPVRSRVMWAAVTLATRWTTNWRRRAGIVLWLIAALAGTAAFGFGAFTGRPQVMIIAALGPLVGAALWGGQFAAGVVAGYALLLIAVPTATCVAAYSVYWLAEQVVLVARKWWHRGDEDVELPRATPFCEVFNGPTATMGAP